MSAGEPGAIQYQKYNSADAGRLLDELTTVFTEVYAEPPYHMGQDEASLFRQRFDVQRQQQGFSLVTACADGGLVGFVLGVPLQPTSTWWSRLLAPLPPET